MLPFTINESRPDNSLKIRITKYELNPRFDPDTFSNPERIKYGEPIGITLATLPEHIYKEEDGHYTIGPQRYWGMYFYPTESWTLDVLLKEAHGRYLEPETARAEFYAGGELVSSEEWGRTPVDGQHPPPERDLPHDTHPFNPAPDGYWDPAEQTLVAAARSVTSAGIEATRAMIDESAITSSSPPRLRVRIAIDALRETGVPCRVYGMRDGPLVGTTDGAIEFRPRSVDGFLEDLVTARGVITGGGFSLLSEAVYLGKPVLSVPLRGQFEQLMNARYLEREGSASARPPSTRPVLEAFLERLDGFHERLEAYKQDGNREALEAIETRVLAAGEDTRRDRARARTAARQKAAA